MFSKNCLLCLLSVFFVNNSSFSMDRIGGEFGSSYNNIMKQKNTLNNQFFNPAERIYVNLSNGIRDGVHEDLTLLGIAIGDLDNGKSRDLLVRFYEEATSELSRIDTKLYKKKQKNIIPDNDDEQMSPALEKKNDMVPLKAKKKITQKNTMNGLLNGNDKRLTSIKYFDADDRQIAERIQSYSDMGDIIPSTLFANVKKLNNVSSPFFECAFLRDAQVGTNFKILPMIHIGSIQNPFEWDMGKLTETQFTKRFKNELNLLKDTYGQVLGIMRSGKTKDSGHYYSFLYNDKAFLITNPAAGKDGEYEKEEYKALSRLMNTNVGAARLGIQSENEACGLSAYMITKSIGILGDAEDACKKLVYGVNTGLIQTIDDFENLLDCDEAEEMKPDSNLFKALEKNIAESVLDFIQPK